MSRIVLTDKGYPFIKDFKIKDDVQSKQDAQIQLSTIKPLFLKRKVNPSKMLLLKDGHSKFYTFDSNELKQICESRQSERKSSLISQTQLQSPQKFYRAKSQTIQEYDIINFVNPLAQKPEEIILKDQVNQFSIKKKKKKLQKILKKSISGVLNLPPPQNKKWGSLSTTNRNLNKNKIRFLTIKEAHLQSDIKIQKQIQQQMEQKTVQLEQHHQEEKFMKTLKIEDEKLKKIITLQERFKQRITSRIKNIHTQRYEKIWGQMNFPKDLEKLNLA